MDLPSDVLAQAFSFLEVHGISAAASACRQSRETEKEGHRGELWRGILCRRYPEVLHMAADPAIAVLTTAASSPSEGQSGNVPEDADASHGKITSKLSPFARLVLDSQWKYLFKWRLGMICDAKDQGEDDLRNHKGAFGRWKRADHISEMYPGDRLEDLDEPASSRPLSNFAAILDMEKAGAGSETMHRSIYVDEIKIDDCFFALDLEPFRQFLAPLIGRDDFRGLQVSVHLVDKRTAKVALIYFGRYQNEEDPGMYPVYGACVLNIGHFAGFSFSQIVGSQGKDSMTRWARILASGQLKFCNEGDELLLRVMFIVGDSFDSNRSFRVIGAELQAFFERGLAFK